MNVSTVSQIREIIEKGGTVGIRTITSVLKNVVEKSEDDFETNDKVTVWEDLHTLKEYACSDAVLGDDDDYHNLAVEYARLDYHNFALDVLAKGLSITKFSPDLLADMILYGIESGQLEKSDTAYSRLMRLDRNAWGWRSYSFVIKYYLEKAKCIPNSKTRETIKGQAIALAEDFVNYARKRSSKDIDRAYNNMASVYKFFGGDDAEGSILQKGFSSVDSAPQCALGLADILFEQGKYEKALPYIEKCIIAVNKPQPDVNASYVHLIYALAKTQRLLANGLNEDSSIQEDVEDIYKHFHIATDAYDAHESFKKVASQTIKSIKIQTGIEDNTNNRGKEEFI